MTLIQNLFVFWFSFDNGSLPWINNCPSVFGGVWGIDKEGAEKSAVDVFSGDLLGLVQFVCDGVLGHRPLIFKNSWHSLLNWCIATLLLSVSVFTWFCNFISRTCVAVLGFTDTFVIHRNLIDAGEGVKRLTPFYPSITISLHSQHWRFILYSSRFLGPLTESISIYW